MANKKKTNPKNNNSSSGENYFVISSDKKKKILGIFLIVLSVFILLSIASYSRFDQANLHYQFSDFFKVFGSSQDTALKADNTHNWLGIFGAYISDFFVNSTLGVFSTVFPIMFFIWGFSFFKKINFRTIIHTSNFLIIIGLLFSSFFGVLRMHYNVFAGVYELSGTVGDYLGMAVSRLLGGVGSILFIAASTIVLLIIAFDIKIEKIFHWLVKAFHRLLNKVKDEYQNAKVEASG